MPQFFFHVLEVLVDARQGEHCHDVGQAFDRMMSS
jgi:hypothetical protein